MSDFLQGVQAGANLYANAQHLQQQRAQYMLQAQQMMQNIRASQALEQYRQQELALRQAEEKRRQAEYERATKQEQAFEAYRAGIPDKREQMLSELMPGYEQEPIPANVRDELLPKVNQRISEDVVMRFGTPTNLTSWLGGEARGEEAYRRALLSNATRANIAEQTLEETTRHNKALEENRAAALEQRKQSAKSKNDADSKRLALLQKSMDMREFSQLSKDVKAWMTARQNAVLLEDKSGEEQATTMIEELLSRQRNLTEPKSGTGTYKKYKVRVKSPESTASETETDPYAP